MAEVLGDIQYAQEIRLGVFANTVGPAEVIDAMYPAGRTDPTRIYEGSPRIVEGIGLVAVNSALRFEDLPGDRTAILGNTVTRLCPVSENCASCPVNGKTIQEMSDMNCARANTAVAFELIGEPPESRFVLLPTGKESFVVDGGGFTQEHNGDELMQNRLKAAPAVVFTESWLRKQGMERFTVGMNGADGSMGVAIARVEGETLIIPFCSMRQNMGDREPEDQILRQAFNAYFDSMGFDAVRRQQAMQGLRISITLAASASLANFAHKIKVPQEGPDASERDRQEAARLRSKYPELVNLAGGRLTAAIVLGDQYPGAFKRGSIFPEFEARAVAGGADLQSPITPDRCPGDGQTCNVHYRQETEYALRKQLEQMGVDTDNILFDDSDVLDPADPSNNAASNRAEQNNGVEVAKTNRTLNAMTIYLP